MTVLEEKLFSIANNEVPVDELEKAFDEVAEELLAKSNLVAGSTAYIIKEIEFYFYSSHYKHEDNYTHYNKRQQQFGAWYFHRLGDAENYNHNRRGVDITFGSKENRGGILIRGIESVENQTIVEGPSKVVGEILEKIKPEGLKLVSAEQNLYVFNEASPLRIVSSSPSFCKIHKTKRFGLSKGYPDFLNKSYRYFIGLTERYKCKDKTNVVLELLGKGSLTKEEAKEILGYNIKAI